MTTSWNMVVSYGQGESEFWILCISPVIFHLYSIVSIWSYGHSYRDLFFSLWIIQFKHFLLTTTWCLSILETLSPSHPCPLFPDSSRSPILDLFSQYLLVPPLQCFFLFLNFWLCWAFIAAWPFFLVVMSRVYSCGAWSSPVAWALQYRTGIFFTKIFTKEPVSLLFLLNLNCMVRSFNNSSLYPEFYCSTILCCNIPAVYFFWAYSWVAEHWWKKTAQHDVFKFLKELVFHFSTNWSIFSSLSCFFFFSCIPCVTDRNYLKSIFVYWLSSLRFCGKESLFILHVPLLLVLDRHLLNRWTCLSLDVTISKNCSSIPISYQSELGIFPLVSCFYVIAFSVPYSFACSVLPLGLFTRIGIVCSLYLCFLV